MSLGRWSLSLAVGLLLLGGCASARNTLAQDLAFERWEKCRDQAQGINLQRITADGQLWVIYTADHRIPTQLVANLHATSRSGARSASDRTCARARGCHCPRSAASFLAQRTRTDLEGR